MALGPLHADDRGEVHHGVTAPHRLGQRPRVEDARDRFRLDAGDPVLQQVEHSDLMTALEELPHDGLADETRATSDENAHSSRYMTRQRDGVTVDRPARAAPRARSATRL